jgi:hypothetical protein
MINTVDSISYTLILSLKQLLLLLLLLFFAAESKFMRQIHVRSFACHEFMMWNKVRNLYEIDISKQEKCNNFIE